MGISVARDDDRKRFTAIATGPLTLAEILRFMSTHRVGKNRMYTLLFDVQGHFNLSPSEIRTLGNHVHSLTSREGERGRTAIVAADDASFARVSQYELESSGASVVIRAFRDTETAERWLDTNT